MNDIIEGHKFITTLERHDLTVLEFLDLVESWQRLSHKTRDVLISEELERRKKSIGQREQ